MFRNGRTTFAMALLTTVAGMMPTGSASAAQNYLYVSGVVGVASTQSARLSVTNLAPNDTRCRGEILNSTSGETQPFVPSAQELSRGAQKTSQLQAQ